MQIHALIRPGGPRRKVSRRLRSLAAAVLASAVVLAGCGSGARSTPPVASIGGSSSPANSSGSPTASMDPKDSSLQLAHCMREHGVDMADPKAGSGAVQFGGPGQDQLKVKAAMKACQRFMQGGLGNPNDPKAKDAQVAMNKCLRKHGLNFTDGADGLPVMPPSVSKEKIEATIKLCVPHAGAGK